MTALSIHRTEKKKSYIKSFCSSVVMVAIFDIICCHNEEETRLKAEENVLQVRDVRNLFNIPNKKRDHKIAQFHAWIS